MMLCKLFKKYKVLIIILLILILIGIGLFIFKSNSKLNSVIENNYSLEYDNSWKINEKSDNYISLKHKASNSLLKVEIVELNNEDKYLDIYDLIDGIIYNIGKQNENYKLLSKKEEIFTKYEFNGFKMLYENDKKQVMIATYKNSSKLVVISYEASSDYFDIVLDSVNNIIYNFNVLDEKFDITNNLQIETSSISYQTSDILDQLLTTSDKVQYEIANNNYNVVYKISKVFQLYSYDSTNNYFNLKIDNAKVTMNVNIYNINIYTYLDSDSSLNLYKNYKYYREGTNCSEFVENISKLDSDFLDSYIYKNSYKTDSTRYINHEIENYKKINENVELIYALNKNHILVINLNSSDVPITEELVNSISIESFNNYPNYSNSITKDGYKLSVLKRYSNSDKNKYEEILIKVPDIYKEMDKKNNLYEERYFGLNYNKEKDLYDYVIKYKLTNISSNDINKLLDTLNSNFIKSYGSYHNYKIGNKKAINGKLFIEYNGGYTNLGGIMLTNVNRYNYYVNKKALFYELNNGGYLIVEISGNGKEISDDIVNQVTNFEISEKGIE